VDHFNRGSGYLGAADGTQPEGLTPEAARYLLRFRFTESDQSRLQELAERSQAGTLTEEEGREFDSYLRIGNLLAVMQSRARLVLSDSEATASFVNAALIRHVYQRAGGICEYCHLPARFFPLTFHVDHITPRQHGGSTEPDNLALACLHCNRHKGPNLAQTNTVRARDTSGVQATIGDGPGSIYVESLEGAIQKFVPVYIDTSEIADPATAGSDETPPVLPVNTPINAVSNESWLTITGESGGAITFSFAATTVARSAVISVLGQDVITQNIVVSQAAPAAIGASAGGARVRERAGRQVLRSRMELVNGLIAGRVHLNGQANEMPPN